MITDVKTLPPGSITLFSVEVDAFGNETYVGGPVTFGGTTATAPTGGTAATYATPPVPKASTPADTSQPGGRSIDISIKEGVLLQDNERRKLTITPDVVTGWTGTEAVNASDDVYATIVAPDGTYCDALELSGFDLSSIPVGATITGIRVTVERSKI